MLEVKQLTKVYKPKNGAEVRALNGVSLKFADKGLVFLLGKSGSGKSTLLNLMGGLDSYTSGDIVIKGKSSTSFKQSDFDSYRNTYIGFIFQEFNILEDYTVGKNIGLALELQHKKSDEEAISRILSQVDLDGYKDRKPNELSGGQKQRVAIARALIKNPEIIMGDEPTGSLDSKTGKQVFETLKKLSKDKLVVVVSHDRENAEFFGDRVIELADGVVISDRIRMGESGELVEQPIDYISPELIKIEGGYQLSQTDIQKINQMLARTKGDVFISSDEGISSHIKASKNLAQNKTRGGGFVNTTNENYPVKSYNKGDFKLVRSKLPQKDALKMGASGLKLKKIRLVFTIILSFFAFFLFGFSNTAAAINEQQSHMRTLSSQGGRGILIQSESGREYSLGEISWNEWSAPGISDTQVQEIEALTGKPLLKLVQKMDQWSNNVIYFNLSLSNNIDTKTQISSSYYISNINYVVETPSLDAAGLTPAKDAPNSKLPQNFSEIAITDYIADTFVDIGYKQVTFNPATNALVTETIKINNYGDLIGKTIYSNNEFYTISGVFNTGFDLADFADYKTAVEGMSQMTAYGFRNLTMGMAYAKEGFSENWQRLNDGEYLQELYPSLLLKDAHDNSDAGELSVYYISKIDAYKNFIVWKDGKNADNFSANDIILSTWDLGVGGRDDNIIKEEFDRFLTEQYSASAKLFINKSEFADVNIVGLINSERLMTDQPSLMNNVFLVHGNMYEQLKSSNNKDANTPVQVNDYAIGNFSSRMLYANSIYNLYRFSTNLSYFPLSNIHFKSGFSLTNGKLKDNQIVIPMGLFIDRYSDNNQQSITFEDAKTFFNSFSADDYLCDIGRYEWGNNGIKIKSVTLDDLEIVGVHSNWDELLVSDNIYDYFANQKSDLKKAVVPLSGDFASDRAVFEYIFDSVVMEDGFGTRIKLFTSLSPIMDMLGSQIPVLRTVFFYISLAFSLFAALLLMNFLGVSINHKKKDIGVLRAIGARSKDVFMIFIYESFIISTINFILSVAAVVILSLVLNSLMGVVIFVPGVIQIALMFALCYGIALVSTYIPVRKIARKKPIDAINNR